MSAHKIITSDAGDVYVEERKWFFVWLFYRTNVRPVSETCEDWRIERGIRIGSWNFLIRRTHRRHKSFQSEWMPTPL